MSQCHIAATLAMQYTLQTAKNKDKTGVMRVLGVLAQNIKGRMKMLEIGQQLELLKLFVYKAIMLTFFLVCHF